VIDTRKQDPDAPESVVLQDQRRWVKLDDRNVDPKNEWHLLDRTYLSDYGIPTVATKCGLTAAWNQTFLDRLPGGAESESTDESAHEACRDLIGVGLVEDAKPKGK
jgi:hypothetical protein